jgi:prepilin-type N-terminal cleavage/methylation domain-containing protein
MTLSKNIRNREGQQNGFSLVETLVVITIMLALASLSALTVPSMMSSQNVAQASSDISQTLDDARSYAIANHTYVFVAFEEVNSLTVANATGQSQATSAGGGRIAVAVAAAKDGLSCSSTSAAPYFNAANLTAISKLKFFTGVHLSDFSGLTAPTSGPMASRAPITSGNSLGANWTGGTTPLFTWPLNASGSSVEYNFYPGQIIMFDQEGVGSMVTSTTYTASGCFPTSAWIEIGLQVTHGANVPTAPSSLATGALRFNLTE